jgi:hypothetical protein
MDAIDDTDLLARRVYSSLCHLTCGSREAADQLLIETYRIVPAEGAENAAWLTFLAHQRAITYTISNTDIPDQLAFWGALSAPERVAIHLRLVERISAAEIANAFGLSEADVSTLIAQGLRKCPPGTTGRDLVRLLQPTELWLGDGVRKRIHEKPPTPVATLVKSRQTVKILALSGVAIATLVVVVVANRSTSGARAQVTTTTSIVASPESSLAPTPPEFHAFEFGPDQTRAQFPIAPEIIVHYPNGKVGLSWTSSCDRPPVRALLVTNPDQTNTLQLSTGAVDIVSCAGMPERWTAVLDVGRRFQDVSIFPVRPDGEIDPTYLANYFSDFVPQTQIVDPEEDYVTHAALVDADQQPWFYGAGCATPTVTRYESPAGPIFEILSSKDEQISGSTNDKLTCQSLAGRAELRTVDGLTFPRFGGQPTDRVDCRGPEGSYRDLHNIGDDGVDKSTSNWTSWDGCLIRGDVINDLPTNPDCTFRARLVSTNLFGESHTYLASSATLLDSFPADALDTGLRNGDEALWISLLDRSFAFVSVGNDRYVWTAVDIEGGCIVSS